MSPHLDDAIFSLGAAIAHATRRGAQVRVVTVMAGDPHSTQRAGEWDAGSGFRTAGEAAAARRDEDRRACGVVGATPVWLPFGDRQYGLAAAPEDVWAAVEEAVGGAAMILLPGFPLEHPDHALLTESVLKRNAGPPTGFYAEQPYVLWRGESVPAGTPGVAGGSAWTPLSVGLRDRWLKWRAVHAYSSQLRQLGRSVPFELARRPESVAWLSR